MPDKEWNKLWLLDQKLRQWFPTQMWDDNETIVTITMFGGFELFNTRAYHNYENWSSGYRITTGKRYGEFTVEAEDLDDAIRKLEEKMIQYNKGKQ